MATRMLVSGWTKRTTARCSLYCTLVRLALPSNLLMSAQGRDRERRYHTVHQQPWSDTSCLLFIAVSEAFFVRGKSLIEQQMLWLLTTHLLVHDDGQLSGQVSVVGFHLVVVLLLVLFDQTLVNAQAVAARLHKMPAKQNKDKWCF